MIWSQNPFKSYFTSKTIDAREKKSVFIWINFSRKKIVIFRFVNTVNFFKSAVKKTWIESGHLNFFFWLCTIPSLFFYYPVCFIQRILKRRSKFWPFFIGNTCKNLVFSIVEILIRKIVNQLNLEFAVQPPKVKIDSSMCWYLP